MEKIKSVKSAKNKNSTLTLMKKIIIATGLALLVTLGISAQTVLFTPGKLVVYRAGNGDGVNFNIANVRQHPVFIDEYDPVTNNQIGPILSVALPTNGPAA